MCLAKLISDSSLNDLEYLSLETVIKNELIQIEELPSVIKSYELFLYDIFKE